MKCCVYTRVFFESPYLDAFIEHYINMGFTKIIMIKVDKITYKCPEKYSEYVNIHERENEGNILLPKYDNFVKNSGYDWCLSVDVDEFLLLDERYSNIQDFIKSKMDIHKRINMFYFRWGMIEKYDNEQNTNIQYIFNNYKIFANKHIKIMVRIKTLKSIIKPHACQLHVQPHVYFENQMLHYVTPQLLAISKNSYNEHVLIHIHTRSLNNLMTKTFKTLLTNKKIKSKEQLKRIIMNYDDKIPNDILLNTFRDVIGLKAKLPFSHSNNGNANINKQKFKIHECKYTIINLEREKQIIKNILKQNNINEDKYYKYINKISDITTDAKFFML